MSQHDSGHIHRLRQEEADTAHQETVQPEFADGPQSTGQEVPDATSGPLGEDRTADGGAQDNSLVSNDLSAILEQRRNHEPNPEIQDALRGLRDIPVREALDKT